MPTVNTKLLIITLLVGGKLAFADLKPPYLSRSSNRSNCVFQIMTRLLSDVPGWGKKNLVWDDFRYDSGIFSYYSPIVNLMDKDTGREYVVRASVSWHKAEWHCEFVRGLYSSTIFSVTDSNGVETVAVTMDASKNLRVKATDCMQLF